MELLSIELSSAGYDEDMSVLKNINFNVRNGEMVGLIGPNGAGKSTTIKTILGLNPYFKGNVSLPSNKSYAYIPEKPVFYYDMTLWEHIDLMAALLEMEEAVWKKRVGDLLELFDLSHVIHESPATFSKGMQQKAMLIFAIMLKPSLYIVDEPFIGLDPIATKKLLELFKVEQQRGAGILLCTHVLDTAEKICDRFVLLSDGQVRAEGTLLDIQDGCHLPEGSLLDCFFTIAEKELAT
ncbi:ABC transporter ATP-binding protein [Sutcliffiella rhizosphaerae]|uniref:ABC-type transporter ATP-binding protein EcsA n=1 Tax=Sutcliffiella rhizosphaerae TaxID=2880967 RepID=A0ABM8YQC8_9BACI|nr:ABC transporter ATP-binding protein [Sutcliffiella rhizosphaerae]CAG9622149.1 ABC-type transporter ATP-binding protein EcsA [Sutcliffiella rhizosphaerae]